MLSIFKRHGVLGINGRNHLYIKPLNPKKAIKLADDKIKSKHYLEARDIPVPKLYTIFKNYDDINNFDFHTLPSSFVIKPNKGSKGGGIIVIVKDKGKFKKLSSEVLSEEYIKTHCKDIIDGAYSMTGNFDQVIIEQQVICNTDIMEYCDIGLPDIRVLSHNLVPVMAMLRIPTKASEGKANMALGAYGVGIDIAKGTCTNIAFNNKIIPKIPHFGKIKGFQIPFWDEILRITSKVQLLTNLGFMAVDIVIDKNNGPMVLEVNARAGLKVQIANLIPLHRRLDKVSDIKVTTPEKGVRVCKDLFGNVVDTKSEDISGKKIIGNIEDIEIITPKHLKKYSALINTQEPYSIIDISIVKALGLKDSIVDNKIKLKFILKNKRIQTMFLVKEKIKSNIIIGNRDLSNFLIDPRHNKEISLPEEKTIKFINKKEFNYKDIDKRLYELNKEHAMLKYMKPINLEEERNKFFNKSNYNPKFKYKKADKEIKDTLKSLDAISISSHKPIGLLLAKAKDKIIQKHKMLLSVGSDEFTTFSKLYFGDTTKTLIEKSNVIISKKKYTPRKDNLISHEKIIKKFNQVFKANKLKDWTIKEDTKIVTRMVIAKNKVIKINPNKRFAKGDIEKLLSHELYTHGFTFENGQLQELNLLSSGIGDYLLTQEGLAIYNQVHYANWDLYKPAHFIKLIELSKNESFNFLYQYLLDSNYSPRHAFSASVRLKRGLGNTKHEGGNTKDVVYLKGYYQVSDYINANGSMIDLYYGKYNLKDLPLIKKSIKLKSPKFLPPWI